MADGGFISVSLVRWMLKQIEKETDLVEIRRDAKYPKNVGVKMLERIERIDTLCEEFHKRIDDERAMLAEVMKWLNES